MSTKETDLTTLHEVEESLRTLDPETLQEMAYQTARSHARVCGLTSQIGDCAHIPDDEMRDRADRLTVPELAELMAPLAWVSIDLGDRLGH